ncbi:hypothetical protein niasHT_025120 [Heterodera trifolii]|uniref:Uncharacterized protein n=1 Tax=Heterodera trifolii TaxID=157864 RepID=A0ABD2K1C4_9BILA
MNFKISAFAVLLLTTCIVLEMPVLISGQCQYDPSIEDCVPSGCTGVCILQGTDQCSCAEPQDLRPSSQQKP